MVLFRLSLFYFWLSNWIVHLSEVFLLSFHRDLFQQSAFDLSGMTTAVWFPGKSGKIVLNPAPSSCHCGERRQNDFIFFPFAFSLSLWIVDFSFVKNFFLFHPWEKDALSLLRTRKKEVHRKILNWQQFIHPLSYWRFPKKWNVLYKYDITNSVTLHLAFILVPKKK